MVSMGTALLLFLARGRQPEVELGGFFWEVPWQMDVLSLGFWCIGL